MQPQPIEYTQPVQYTQPGAIPQPSQYQQPATQYVQTTQPMQQFSQQPAPQMMGAPQQVVYVTQGKPKVKFHGWSSPNRLFHCSYHTFPSLESLFLDSR